MATTRYIWDYASDAYLMEKDETGATTAVYTNEPVQYGNLVSQRRSDATRYHHFDGQESTRELTDAEEVVTDNCTYSAFGTDTASSGATPNRFTVGGGAGYYADQAAETFSVRSRTFSPAEARWISRDPIAIDANRYWYVGNNPIGLLDPSGLMPPGWDARTPGIGLPDHGIPPATPVGRWIPGSGRTEISVAPSMDSATRTIPNIDCHPPLGQSRCWCKAAYAGVWIDPEALSWCICLMWHEHECHRDRSQWIRLLPACPCNIGNPARNPDSSRWESPVKPGILEKPGHPNAASCIRSKPSSVHEHGQQCCYDRNGALITGGPSAGTPDYVSPGRSTRRHYIEDVRAYYQCKSIGATGIYFQHRPPNNGNGCRRNVV